RPRTERAARGVGQPAHAGPRPPGGTPGSCAPAQYEASRLSHVRSALDEVLPAALAGREPPAGDGLLARVEIHGVRTVRVQGAEEAVLPAREREERDGRLEPDVDADHPGLDLMPVAANRRAGLGEDRRAVAEPRPVDDRDRLVERRRLDHAQDRPEDL